MTKLNSMTNIGKEMELKLMSVDISSLKSRVFKHLFSSFIYTSRCD